MLSALLIAFRETLEAALIVGIVLTYLRETGNESKRVVVLFAVAAAVVASLLGLFTFDVIEQSFSGKGEMLFEGSVQLAGLV